MKRSEINKIIKDAIAFLDKHKFLLPPFAYFTPEEWKEKNHEYDEIRRNVLGWDITDFGSGDSAAAVFSSLPFATATLSIPTTKRYMPKKS